MKKILICIAFAIFTVLLLTGCGDKNDKDAPKVVSFGGGVDINNTNPLYEFVKEDTRKNDFVMTIQFEETYEHLIERLYFKTSPERLCYFEDADEQIFIGSSEGFKVNVLENHFFLWFNFKTISLDNPNTIQLVGVDYRVGDTLKHANGYKNKISFERSEYFYA